MIKKFWINLMVKDIHRTIRFYRDFLGFEHVMSVPKDSEEVLTSYDQERPLVYAMLKMGDIELMFQEMLSLKENVPAFDSIDVCSATATLYFEVDDLDGIVSKLSSACSVVREPHETFYGMREYYVRDPDGYVLGFSQPSKGS